MMNKMRPVASRLLGNRQPMAINSAQRQFAAAGAAAPKSDPGASSALVPSQTENDMPVDRRSMTPAQMVEYLDRYIIGQSDAKKAVANALRMRWRRQQLTPELTTKSCSKRFFQHWKAIDIFLCESHLVNLILCKVA